MNWFSLNTFYSVLTILYLYMITNFDSHGLSTVVIIVYITVIAIIISSFIMSLTIIVLFSIILFNIFA